MATKIEKLLDIVYLPDWSTEAYICEGGLVYIPIMKGRNFTKEEFLKECEMMPYSKEQIQKRIELFDDLYNYYLDNYGNK